MRKLAWIAAAGALLALTVVLGSGLLGGQGVHAQPFVIFDIDPDPTGNTASNLGTVEDFYDVTCPSASCSWDGVSTFDDVSDYNIDIVVSEMTYAPGAYDASLNYDPSIVHVAAPGTDNLIKLPGATDLSDLRPDSDGIYGASAVYTSGGPGTAGDGTIVRVGLDIGGSGVVTFTLNGPPLTGYYVSGGGWTSVGWDGAQLAINAPSPASPAVGGIAELPDASDSSPHNYIPLASLAAAALAALTAGAWYARRPRGE